MKTKHYLWIVSVVNTMPKEDIKSAILLLYDEDTDNKHILIENIKNGSKNRKIEEYGKEILDKLEKGELIGDWYDKIIQQYNAYLDQKFI